jgi:2-iminobutanoate/2-iminopropanoate deaminase
MAKTTLIHPPGLPPPRGAYSHAVKLELGGAVLLFVTGQLALDSENRVLAPGDAAAQAEVIFRLIGEILAAAGLGFADVVRVQTFLTDMADFPRYSAVRNRYFEATRPASTLLEVKGLAHPGCVVEVEVTAAR